jgi:hypothetical protein
MHTSLRHEFISGRARNSDTQEKTVSTTSRFRVSLHARIAMRTQPDGRQDQQAAGTVIRRLVDSPKFAGDGYVDHVRGATIAGFKVADAMLARRVA